MEKLNVDINMTQKKKDKKKTLVFFPTTKPNREEKHKSRLLLVFFFFFFGRRSRLAIQYITIPRPATPPQTEIDRVRRGFTYYARRPVVFDKRSQSTGGFFKKKKKSGRNGGTFRFEVFCKI